MPVQFESQSDLIVPPTLVDRGRCTRNLHCGGMKTNARSPDRTAGAVNGAVRTDEEDTLSKARKAAKVHLNALKEHVDKVPVIGGRIW